MSRAFEKNPKSSNALIAFYFRLFFTGLDSTADTMIVRMWEAYRFNDKN